MKIIINIINIVVVLTVSTILVVFCMRPVEIPKVQVLAAVKKLQAKTLTGSLLKEVAVKGKEKISVILAGTGDAIISGEIKADVLESQVGNMSGYGPDCLGCSGYLASGKYVGDGTSYYSDSTYGTVRILAGDSTYPFGSIVRIKNSRVDTEVLGIVLDRGGAIGFGKKFLFDLLYSSEQLAAKDEVSYNTTFEILRYGY